MRHMFLLSLLCVLAFAGCTSSDTSDHVKTQGIKTTSTATILILPRQDLFTPFIVPVWPGTLVTWQNQDMLAHSFSTTPQHNAYVNPSAFSFTVAAGKSVSIRVTSPGFYHYYETTRTTWNTTFTRVAADPSSEHFPLAMDGVLWVQGSVGQLPLAAINHVVHGHDDFATEFLAIRAGGTVTWHNFDEDAHFLDIVAGWSPPINPFDFGLYRIAGTKDVPGGESVTIVFNTPGLYYYYCRNHGIINMSTTRVQALPKDSEYPIPMEGFVLVNSA